MAIGSDVALPVCTTLLCVSVAVGLYCWTAVQKLREEIEDKQKRLEDLVALKTARPEAVEAQRNQFDPPTTPVATERISDEDRLRDEATFQAPPVKPGKQRFQVLLVRHAESEGNVRPDVYRTTPDSKIKLTERGHQMAKITGQKIKEYINSQFPPDTPPRVSLWISPFERTRQTAVEIVEALGCDVVTSIRESVLLVEQDWGLFEGPGLEEAKEKYREEYNRCELMKKHQGKFWARLPLGENCFDVCQRVQILFSSIMRDRFGIGERSPSDIVIVVSHGITIRAFVMMWCHYKTEWFEASHNPPNCSVRLIDSDDSNRDSESGDANKGYIFGGWEKDADLGNPASLDELRAHDKRIENLKQTRHGILTPQAFLECNRHSSGDDKPDPTSFVRVSGALFGTRQERLSRTASVASTCDSPSPQSFKHPTPTRGSLPLLRGSSGDN